MLCPKGLFTGDRYKGFLDDITPPEWFAEQRIEREKELQARYERWQAECDVIKQHKLDAKGARPEQFSGIILKQVIMLVFGLAMPDIRVWQ